MELSGNGGVLEIDLPWNFTFFNVKSLTFEHVEYPPPRLFNVSSPFLPETMISRLPLESEFEDLRPHEWFLAALRCGKMIATWPLWQIGVILFRLNTGLFLVVTDASVRVAVNYLQSAFIFLFLEDMTESIKKSQKDEIKKVVLKLTDLLNRKSFVSPLLQSRKICRRHKWMVGPKYKFSAYSLCFFYCFFGKRWSTLPSLFLNPLHFLVGWDIHTVNLSICICFFF